MKARIRKTGEVVDIITYSGITIRNECIDRVSYIDSKGVEHDGKTLNYYWDFEQITDDKEDKFPIINWQQVRVDAAIAAMPLVYNLMDGVCCTQPKYPNQTSRAETFAKECVGFADALIKELKKQ